jgi:hypothetical protein
MLAPSWGQRQGQGLCTSCMALPVCLLCISCDSGSSALATLAVHRSHTCRLAYYSSSCTQDVTAMRLGAMSGQEAWGRCHRLLAYSRPYLKEVLGPWVPPSQLEDFAVRPVTDCSLLWTAARALERCGPPAFVALGSFTQKGRWRCTRGGARSSS